jgi:hypothetical protein
VQPAPQSSLIVKDLVLVSIAKIYPIWGANLDPKWAHHSVGCPEDTLIHGFNSSQLKWCCAVP